MNYDSLCSLVDHFAVCVNPVVCKCIVIFNENKRISDIYIHEGGTHFCVKNGTSFFYTYNGNFVVEWMGKDMRLTYFQKEIQFSDNCRDTILKMAGLYLFLLFNKKMKVYFKIDLLIFCCHAFMRILFDKLSWVISVT